MWLEEFSKLLEKLAVAREVAGRIFPLHLGPFTMLFAFPRARAGGPSASGFDPAAPARSYGDSSARADRNRWPRGRTAFEAHPHVG